MDTYSENGKYLEIVKSEILKLEDGKTVTAFDLTKKIELPKSIINRSLYKLFNTGFIDMMGGRPPRWCKKDDKCINKKTQSYNEDDDSNNDGNKYLINDKTFSDWNIPDNMFSDTITSEKMDNWKDKSPLIVLNEYCQYTNRSFITLVKYVECSKKPLFSANVVISDKRFCAGIGKTKKEAKAKAARIAVDNILETANIKF
ncbi:double-stranded RNA-specific adenosine [Brazilian porcupinepox virus 1]|nr:double-stranded RNA-specific adenosine [Brazilian porcupinepox virus 1]